MTDDADFVVISSPGSMATRWLAQCLSRVPDLLVLHANNIIVPMEKDPSDKDLRIMIFIMNLYILTL